VNKNIVGFIVFAACMLLMAYLSSYYWQHQDQAPLALYYGFLLGVIATLASEYRMKK
jgi:hypothetical protein